MDWVELVTVPLLDFTDIIYNGSVLRVEITGRIEGINIAVQCEESSNLAKTNQAGQTARM